MLDLSNSILIGKGSSRICYVHPEDDRKCVKVIYIRKPGINRLEMKHYRRFKRRCVSWDMMARPYGFVETTEGEGVVFTLSRDFDGEISRSLDWYLRYDHVADMAGQLRDALARFRDFLFGEGIVVRELKPDNFVFQRVSATEGRLVLIDGVGNNQFLPFASYSRVLARRLLKRKWAKFERQLLDSGAARILVPRQS